MFQRYLSFGGLWCVAIFLSANLPSRAQDKEKSKKADPPKIRAWAPLGVLAQDKPKVLIRGSKFENVCQVLCNNPNLEVKILGGVKKIANQPGGDTEIQVELNFKQKIAEKNLELRLVSKESTSEPLILIVDLPGQITREMEPNDGFSTAQKIQAPTVIEGTIGKPQDVDVYCLDLKNGDNLELSVWASRLKTITDPILSLYDSEKNLLKLVDDMSGSRDPELKYVIAKDGKYYFSITEANDQGGPVFLTAWM